MELHVFGQNASSQLAPPESIAHIPGPKDAIRYPVKVLHATGNVQILWASWCDALIALYGEHKDSKPELVYLGTGRVAPDVVLATVKNAATAKFFGGAMAAGLQGVVDRDVDGRQVVSLFNFWSTREGCTATSSTQSPVDVYTLRGPCCIEHIAVHSNEGITVVFSLPAETGSVSSVPEDESTSNYIQHFFTLFDFKAWLQGLSQMPSKASIARPFPRITRLVANATTLTALNIKGQVYTWTHDPRYPKCLGRSVDEDAPAHIPSPIPYLSETHITKIDSGGYMTAAVSADGELYIWGQACPSPTTSSSSDEAPELYYLKDDSAVPNAAFGPDENLFIPGPVGTDSYLPPPPMRYMPWSYQNAVAWAREVAIMRRDGLLPRHPLDPRPDIPEDEVDEFVKCVPVSLMNHPTSAIDVAVGHGHVLVAVEAQRGSTILRAIAGMGENGKGQLGRTHGAMTQGKAMGFVAKLDVYSMMDRKVKAMACAGWSSWVVVERNEKFEPQYS